MTQAALKQVDGPAYWGEPAAQTSPFSGEAACVATNDLSRPGIAGQIAKVVVAIRRDRQQHFPKALSNESCWGVLLHLYAAYVDQHRLHVSTLTERTGIPGTTVLRALDSLFAAGFISRNEDRFDRRKVVVELTDTGAEAMKSYLLKTGTRAALL